MLFRSLGDKSQSGDANIKWIDGFIEQMKDEYASLASYNSAVTFGTSAWNAIYGVYEVLPEEVLDRGAEIYVGPGLYRSFILGLLSNNLFHFSAPNEAYPDEIFLPGTNAKLVKTPGLAGTKHIVGTFPDNLVYGCDMENDNEDIKVWFSDDDDIWKVKVNWNSGVAYHFPSMIVLHTIADS